MSDLDLGALKALAEKATPGPWEHGDRQSIAGVMPEQYGEGRCAYCRLGEPSWVGRRDINGVRMLAHVHVQDEPWWDHGIFAWRKDGSLNIVNDTDEYGYMVQADAEYIAAVSPEVVLGLIERVQAAEAVIAEVTEAWWSGTEPGDDGVHYSDDIEHAMDVIWAALARHENGGTDE